MTKSQQVNKIKVLNLHRHTLSCIDLAMKGAKHPYKTQMSGFSFEGILSTDMDELNEEEAKTLSYFRIIPLRQSCMKLRGTTMTLSGFTFKFCIKDNINVIIPEKKIDKIVYEQIKN